MLSKPNVDAQTPTCSVGDALIRCKGLCKSFGKLTVVHDLNLAIRAGSCFGLLGPNGAGKSTTLRMILGQSPPSDGVLEVFGKDIRHHGRDIRARTGVVPQADTLDPDFSVIENITIYARYFGLRPDVMQHEIEELLNLVELSDRRHSRVSTLSGGMKRRLTIARALVNDPELLVLDEPTTGLDPQARHLVWALIHGLKRSGKTIILTTHYLEEAERLCDNLVLIDHGHAVARGSTKELIATHCEKAVVEIRDTLNPLQKQAIEHVATRLEYSGDTTYAYTSDSTRLATAIDDLKLEQVLHRHATLEDVFLRLTGRGIRD